MARHTFGPEEGCYGIGSYVTLSPGDGTAMTAGELAQCTDSDDDRFSSSAAYRNPPYHMFKFDASPYPTDAFTRVEFTGEAYCAFDSGDIPPITALFVWAHDPLAGAPKWHNVGTAQHENPYDTELSPGVNNNEQGYIDDDGTVWIMLWGGWDPGDPPTAPMFPFTFYTDFVEIVVHSPSKVALDESLFGQRFRVFDDGDSDDVSFERLDLASGDWSSPTQPFAGDSNHSPDIECLPTGHLRAAYIDSSGDLQQKLSKDDGETWGAV